MTSHENEFLDPMTWLDRIRRFARGLYASETSPERHIRTAYHLVRLAPGMVSRSLPEPIEEATFEAMLADGRYESAVTTLIGSQDAARPTEGTATTSDRSLAMLEDWAGGFVRLETQPS